MAPTVLHTRPIETKEWDNFNSLLDTFNCPIIYQNFILQNCLSSNTQGSEINSYSIYFIQISTCD
jgi:hypothetical protein